jgi:hypothetical protein
MTADVASASWSSTQGRKASISSSHRATKDALRPYGGTVLQTSLTRDAEQQLMKALHGDVQAAATWAQRQDSAEAFT